MPALIYAEQEGGLISVIVPDDEAELDRVVLQPGEAMLVISPKEYAAAGGDNLIENGHDVLQALVSAVTKKAPPSPVMAVVDRASGEVVDRILAYPSTFKALPSFELIRTTVARKGDRYVDGKRTDDDIERVIAEKQAAALEVLP